LERGITKEGSAPLLDALVKKGVACREGLTPLSKNLPLSSQPELSIFTMPQAGEGPGLARRSLGAGGGEVIAIYPVLIKLVSRS
jgi:hypothetical protein